MVFVHHYGSTRDSEEFRSGVHLTLTDGQVTTAVAMDADNFNGEHWGGWLCQDGGSFL